MSTGENDVLNGGWDLARLADEIRFWERREKQVVGANLPDEDATFASGSERSTNHVPLHHAGCLMAGAPFASASASTKSLTEHRANGRSGRGEGSSAQLQLRSKGPKLNSTGLLGGANRRLQITA